MDEGREGMSRWGEDREGIHAGVGAAARALFDMLLLHTTSPPHHNARHHDQHHHIRIGIWTLV